MSIAVITSATSSVVCKPGEPKEHVFTVTNTSGAQLRLGCKVVVDDPAKAEWLAIEGAVECDLADQASDQVTVKVQVPAGTPEGRYTFHLLVYSTEEPGEQFTKGETVTFEVLPPKVVDSNSHSPPPSRWWIAVVVAVVLLIGGGLTWWLWPKDVIVPALEDQPRDIAEGMIQKSGLALGRVSEEENEGKSPGTVLKQDPPAGSEVKKGSPVDLSVSIAPTAVAVPRLKDRMRDEAEGVIRDLGLVVGTIHEQEDTRKSPGMVLRQVPAAGGKARKGSKVDLWLAKRPAVDPDAKKKVYCKKYAQTAINQNVRNIQRRCGFTGSRWQSNYEPHYDWCMAGQNWRTNAPREEAARKNGLANQCSVVIYEHANYRGRSKKFYPGNYDIRQLGIGNDVLSSIKVPKGMGVRIYEHAGFKGKSKEYTANVSFVGNAWNDKTSSIKVYSKRVHAAIVRPLAPQRLRVQ